MGHKQEVAVDENNKRPSEPLPETLYATHSKQKTTAHLKAGILFAFWCSLMKFSFAIMLAADRKPETDHNFLSHIISSWRQIKHVGLISSHLLS